MEKLDWPPLRFKLIILDIPLVFEIYIDFLWSLFVGGDNVMIINNENVKSVINKRK